MVIADLVSGVGRQVQGNVERRLSDDIGMDGKCGPERAARFVAALKLKLKLRMKLKFKQKNHDRDQTVVY
jgi:hypothetical protein